MSLYDSSKEDFEENEFEFFEYAFLSGLESDDNCIVTLENGNKIAIITVSDKNIETYNSISVGDPISKIEDTFKFVKYGRK